MGNIMKVIVFQMNEQQYAINIEQVRSIERLQDITEIPRTSAFIKGVINYQDEVVPIVDLKERMGIGETIHTESTRILVAILNELQVGFLVDSATDVIDIDSTIVETAPKIIKNVSTDYLAGVAKLTNDLLLILDTELLFNDEEMEEVVQAVE